jgi:hypothetical protein
MMSGLHAEQETQRLAFLMQDAYVGARTGEPVSKEGIDFLAPYLPLSDGFYKWQCQGCLHTHGSRAYGPLTGTVEQCEECSKSNLLVATDTDVIAKARTLMFTNDQREKELTRLRDIERTAASKVAQAVNVEAGTWAARIRTFLMAEIEREAALETDLNLKGAPSNER